MMCYLLFLQFALLSPLVVTGNVCDVSDSQRFDCFPGNNPNEEECVKRGCCWKPSSNNGEPPLDVPYCYYGIGNFGYNVTSKEETKTGFILDLIRLGPGGQFGGNVDTLKVDFSFEKKWLKVKIFDPSNKRYEVPVPTTQVSAKESNPIYDVEYSEYPFGFAVKRKSTGVTIFDTRCGGLVFSDQFLQVSSLLPSHNLYGLGEHVLGLKLNTKWTKLTMFSRDVATPEGGVNLYGVHPFYLNVENGGKANGVLLKNSNAMDIILQPTPAITYRTIGGVLDFHVMLGETPNEVVQIYNQIIGLPTMPPYWSLGFHLCRYGYNSIENMKMVRSRMQANNIPQDVQWNDIDYMDAYRDFTIDNNKFAGLSEFVDDLHEKGMHYVIITDPAISSTKQGYLPYDEGIKMDVFIKDANNNVLIGKVWPGETAFPDFFHPHAGDYWYNQISRFHQELKFDGMWIDMNEPSNFVQGSTKGCPNNNLEHPPFLPGIIGGLLYDKTICMSSKQAISNHYDLHSLYGYSEAVQTMSAMKKVLNRRTLVLSRSTYAGSGHHTSHWLGDNHSTWEDLYRSIAGILNFNMFGIPMVGADICGFIGDTTEELCSRWMQLGAFYPFSRNHNNLGQRDQDPGAFGQQLIVASTQALKVRYTLLPYLYTLFFYANQLGDAVGRPLLFQYPEDSQTYDINTQFMWGDGLLISPVLKQGATSVRAYFPEDRWYEYYTGSILHNVGYVDLPASFENVNLHIRGGTIIPTQKAGLTTTESRTNPFGLIVALDGKGDASGSLYLDDGDQLIDGGVTGTSMMDFDCQQGALHIRPVRTGYTPSQNSLESITVLGVMHAPKTVVYNEKRIGFEYDSKVLKLSFTLTGASILEESMIKWY